MVAYYEMLPKTLKMKNLKSAHKVVTNKTLYQEPSSPAGKLNFLAVGIFCQEHEGTCLRTWNLMDWRNSVPYITKLSRP